MAEEPYVPASAPMYRSTSYRESLSIAKGSSDDLLKRRLHDRWRLPHYASPTGQLVIVYTIYVLCPGVYWNIFSTIPAFQCTLNYALLASYEVRATEYAIPSVIGFFSGILINQVGPRYSLLAGCVGYPLKCLSILCYNYTLNRGFVGFAGVVLSICQGISGSVVPYLMLAYSTERAKGRWIAWFLGLWSLSAFIGAVTSLTQTRGEGSIGYYQNYCPVSPEGTPPRIAGGLFAPILVLAALGTCLSWLVVDPKRNHLGDLSGKDTKDARTWSYLTLRLWNDISGDPYILCLFPLFFVSTWFYGYQLAKANSNIRFTQGAQALNLVLYWAMSMIGSLTFGYALDFLRNTRRIRARCTWLVLLVLTITIWSGGRVFQSKNDAYVDNFLQYDDEGHYEGPIGFTKKAYWGPAILFMFYGLHSAVWQVASYWIIGSLTNNDRKLANYAGFYNAVQSAGNAIIWRLVSPGAYVVGMSNRSVFDATWTLALASLFIAAPTFFWGMRDFGQPTQMFLAVRQTNRDEAQQFALPNDDAVIPMEIAAVALPRQTTPNTGANSRAGLFTTVKYAAYMLITVVVLLPVGLAALGVLVNTGGSEGCLPDGTFAIPGNFDVWNPKYLLTLTVGFGHMSFPVVRFLDLAWDIVIGHGGQALLVWLAYKTLTRYVVCLMENDGVTTQTYAAVAFHTGSLRGACMLIQDLIKRKSFTVTRYLAMMIYIGIYVLIFPAVISAMTSYAPFGTAYVTFTVTNINGTTTLNQPFLDFQLVNQTNGTWTYQNMTYLTTPELLNQASCQPTNKYRWGFSYLLLFVFSVASALFVVLLVILRQHDGLDSKAYHTGYYAPSLWRSVMDMSSHARAVATEDMEHMETEQLEERMQGTRMAFNKDDLTAVQAAVAVTEAQAKAVSAAAKQAGREKKAAKGFRARAVRRRRKIVGVLKGYDSLPAPYEGV